MRTCQYKGGGDWSGCSDAHCSDNNWVCLTRKIIKGVCLSLQEGGMGVGVTLPYSMLTKVGKYDRLVDF